MFGFNKSDKDNISSVDERTFAETGAMLLGLGTREIQTLIEIGELWEIEWNDAD